MRTKATLSFKEIEKKIKDLPVHHVVEACDFCAGHAKDYIELDTVLYAISSLFENKTKKKGKKRNG